MSILKHDSVCEQQEKIWKISCEKGFGINPNSEDPVQTEFTQRLISSLVLIICRLYDVFCGVTCCKVDFRACADPEGSGLPFKITKI